MITVVIRLRQRIWIFGSIRLCIRLSSRWRTLTQKTGKVLSVSYLNVAIVVWDNYKRFPPPPTSLLLLWFFSNADSIPKHYLPGREKIRCSLSARQERHEYADNRIAHRFPRLGWITDLLWRPTSAYFDTHCLQFRPFAVYGLYQGP